MANNFPNFGDLTAWSRFLSHGALPVLASTRKALDLLKTQGDALAPSDLAAIALRDPLFATTIIRHLQNHRNRLRAMDITTIEHAIMMLGIEPFYAHFGSSQTIEDVLAGKATARAAIFALARRGYVASRLAQHWAAQSKDMHSEEIQVAALIHDVAEMLLWIKAPAHAFLIRKAMEEHPGMRSAAAQSQILGFPLNQVEALICQDWGLPALLIELFEDQIATSRAMAVSLAVKLARHSARSWDNPALPDDWNAVAQRRSLGFADAQAAEESLRPFAQSLMDRWDLHNQPSDPQRG